MMCQRSFHEIPLQMFVQSMYQLARQVKENTGHCRDFLFEHDNQLNDAFLGAEQTATQLQSQLEQIMRDLDISEQRVRPQQTTFTYYDE